MKSAINFCFRIGLLVLGAIFLHSIIGGLVNHCSLNPICNVLIVIFDNAVIPFMQWVSHLFIGYVLAFVFSGGIAVGISLEIRYRYGVKHDDENIRGAQLLLLGFIVAIAILYFHIRLEIPSPLLMDLGAIAGLGFMLWYAPKELVSDFQGYRDCYERRRLSKLKEKRSKQERWDAGLCPHCGKMRVALMEQCIHCKGWYDRW